MCNNRNTVTKFALCETVRSDGMEDRRRKAAVRLLETSFHKSSSFFRPNTLITINLKSSSRHMSFILCPKQHFTHSFLACDTRNDCGHKYFVNHCPVFSNTTGLMTKQEEDSLLLRQTQNTMGDAFVSMFLCQDGVSRVHYTLVCDFRYDCQDKSDETFSGTPLVKASCARTVSVCAATSSATRELNV